MTFVSRGIDPVQALRDNVQEVAQAVLDYARQSFRWGRGSSPFQRKAPSGGRTQVLGGRRRTRSQAEGPERGRGSTNIVQEIRKMQTDLRLY